jgi:transcriptional regulator with XRE-family HTH domain
MPCLIYETINNDNNNIITKRNYVNKKSYDTKYFMEKVSERLRNVILALGMNQADFANSIGTTPATLSRQINGVHRVDKQAALAIQAVHNISAEWLLTGEGEMFLEARPVASLSMAQPEERYETPSPRKGPITKNGLRAIDGSVQEYPDIDIVDKISRTKWWKDLSEEDRVVIAHLILVKDKDLKKKVGNILGSKLDEEEAQEKLHEELMEIERQMTRAKKQKGEAG